MALALGSSDISIPQDCKDGISAGFTTSSSKLSPLQKLFQIFTSNTCGMSDQLKKLLKTYESKLSSSEQKEQLKAILQGL
ncbi:MAG: hypothetical protein RMI34_00880, partial [Chloroherpetonaceae bacterium]|nr:hypothetical protein [Chloroherpetonaceae bacterium]MDW8018614.1 hypothetical protein [Chloroherpetonaceae bacterium]